MGGVWRVAKDYPVLANRKNDNVIFLLQIEIRTEIFLSALFITAHSEADHGRI
ncbi:hypothetical protein AGABI2DRAFT_138827 [Agaricus bisporus var. bisporus H97]|uniref:hypothetical protein n=1 Tax=Agaricus bisporus var. bisporus (strain H97 / ATCC MYA-4626 / FGSC 10389) TaxID=936046 RepID=UPI00029F7B53|nr:hypothetical protein AGABI2DRAFT_138827 [Agaricus bisporus var. bisporus H97]EKV43666.1 hypothetical protein AGABI2DRAFT_138827 [Agaricus bisporus var. bisporus H97]